MCLDFPAHNFFLFFHPFFSLWLSWKKLFCWMSYPCVIMNKNAKFCMVGNHLRWLLRPWLNFLSLFFAFWNYNVPSCIQMKCSCRCGFLSQGVLHMQHQPMCKTGLDCLILYSFYHVLCVLDISIIDSILPFPLWCPWSI